MKIVGPFLFILALGAALVAFFWRDTFEPESLSGARVLVTGASDGIGEQMAYHYARFGAELVLTARREAVLQKVTEKCLKLGAKKAVYFPADMASPQEPEKLVQFALQSLGGLDYVVLNHIGWSPFEMWGGDVNHTRWLMEVNFLSYVAIASAALPTLIERKGAIIVVSSLAGRLATPFTTSYSATKFALEGFFGSLRQELNMQKKDVSVTLCVLGLIDTESALTKVRGVTTMTAAPASEAALAIVKGGATRAMEIFYPWSTWWLCQIRDWFPYQRDWVIRKFYNYTSA
ncbi:hydroxysteroid 11-beta-dehydrogenase 1-like protein [Hemicordylus capensis]|uniref:hydroxysteroid 11-beta-dehydrogenase 1-like protein n=1 Tax=Hemicordylus capensis TaxID=884348 RepID=UPI00230214F0|nr:hydroxysteroid 11-beta-dehydrogenase 1-like protein [Hemicordylus capensis]XP_053148583.1 hydroxysteroid 11-beta-dehydrogenase 1-like protein [Hemicordylus capensis]XP_053148584.1 hydroxysteroid 11-beta-dehydrogenase 1-like protein [Hemicordylus capensis]